MDLPVLKSHAILSSLLLSVSACSFDTSAALRARPWDGGIANVPDGPIGENFSPDAASPDATASVPDASVVVMPPDAAVPDAARLPPDASTGLPFGSTCDLWEQDCAEGLMCNWYSVSCVPEGESELGEPCGAPTDCAPLLMCMQVVLQDDTPVCYQICANDAGCPPGMTCYATTREHVGVCRGAASLRSGSMR
jgi:hypothetical protein